MRTGEEITEERLGKIEEAEGCLFRLGFSDFRVRTAGGTALLQFTAEQLPAARQAQEQITAQMSAWFDQVRIDPEGREKSL